MGHEYVGIVEEVGSEVKRIRASRPAARLAGPLEASMDCRRQPA
jgi:D-arabinose 1-dehydrogenase-like Zn-dependent alcohol dehydrogenase